MTEEKIKSSTKRAISHGAFGGFIAGVAFTGVMLWLPAISHLPIGIFLNALGLSVTSNEGDSIGIGLAAFGIILVQCILVGIVFGFFSSRLKSLHTSTGKRGAVFGLAAGVIAYLVLFVPVIFTIYPSLLSKSITTFPQTALFSIQGSHENVTVNNNIPSSSGLYISTMLGYGLFAYLVFGFILGGIMTWMYSVY
nr:hypothetical protein [Thermoproteota archaeon]